MQEIRVTGDGERVDWVLGSFYSTSEREYGQSAYAENYVAINGSAVSNFLRLVTGVSDLVWSGSRSLAGRPDTEELFFSDLNYDFDQLALFSEVSLAVTDRFSLTGGLRWYDFDEERTQTFDGLFADPLDSEGTTSATGVAPRIIASYDVTAATQVNAQVSKGFRLGGINDPLNAPICSAADLASQQHNIGVSRQNRDELSLNALCPGLAIMLGHVLEGALVRCRDLILVEYSVLCGQDVPSISPRFSVRTHALEQRRDIELTSWRRNRALALDAGDQRHHGTPCAPVRRGRCFCLDAHAASVDRRPESSAALSAALPTGSTRQGEPDSQGRSSSVRRRRDDLVARAHGRQHHRAAERHPVVARRAGIPTDSSMQFCRNPPPHTCVRLRTRPQRGGPAQIRSLL